MCTKLRTFAGIWTDIVTVRSVFHGQKFLINGRFKSPSKLYFFQGLVNETRHWKDASLLQLFHNDVIMFMCNVYHMTNSKIMCEEIVNKPTKSCKHNTSWWSWGLWDGQQVGWEMILNFQSILAFIFSNMNRRFTIRIREGFWKILSLLELREVHIYETRIEYFPNTYTCTYRYLFHQIHIIYFIAGDLQPPPYTWSNSWCFLD